MKRKVLVFTLLISLLTFSGCKTNKVDSTDKSTIKEEVSNSKEVEKKTTITLLDEESELSKREIVFEDGEKLFDVLKKNYAIEDNDGMISSIDGHAQDDKKINIGYLR